jgi:hypothetical protein
VSSPVKLYQQELHKNIGYFATWLPGAALELGDVGVFQAGQFHKVASLTELGIPANAGASGAPQKLEYSSTESTSIDTGASGDLPATAKAEVSVKFGRQGSFVFQALGVRSVQLADKVATIAKIVSAYENGAWQKEWLVVDSLYAADSATIIVSEDESAEIVLKASSTLPLASLSLADPALGLSVSATRGKLVYVIAGNGLRPLYSCLRLRKLPFHDPKVVAVRGLADPHAPAVDQLSYASIDELLES